MKRNSILITSIALFILFLASCERDDICAASTATTPKAIITFYDVANQETLKSVTGLHIIGESQENPLSYINGITSDSIAIPLRTDATETKYFFHKDYVDTDNVGNPDLVTITYDPEEIYVSRACGFKSIFRNFTIVVEDDGDNWIQTTLNVTENLSIENEDQAHINITH